MNTIYIKENIQKNGIIIFLLQIVYPQLRPEDRVVCLQLFPCCHHRYYFLELGVTIVIQVKSNHHKAKHAPTLPTKSSIQQHPIIKEIMEQRQLAIRMRKLDLI
jgi:hypothetical protein